MSWMCQQTNLCFVSLLATQRQLGWVCNRIWTALMDQMSIPGLFQWLAVPCWLQDWRIMLLLLKLLLLLLSWPYWLGVRHVLVPEMSSQASSPGSQSDLRHAVAHLPHPAPLHCHDLHRELVWRV